MTNSRMSLADFLRARIAADEVQARIATGRLGNEGADRSGAWGWWAASPYGGRDHIVACGPKRALAECESKRRIVEMAVARDSYSDAVLLGYLATPYADHPDYREEWKP